MKFLFYEVGTLSSVSLSSSSLCGYVLKLLIQVWWVFKLMNSLHFDQFPIFHSVWSGFNGKHTTAAFISVWVVVVFMFSHETCLLPQLMSKMAPLLGQEVTEEVFLPRFTDLCSHEMVAIRKTCASNFGDFCAVVSRHVTETELVCVTRE